MSDTAAHSTTLKMKSGISNGIRLMAASSGISIAEQAEAAVARILAYHSRPAERLPPRNARVGRPAPNIEQAAAAILRSRPDRNEAVPTRIAPSAAKSLDELADELGTQMNHLAEQGAIQLLKEGPRIAKDIAGLSGTDAYDRALAAVRDLNEGRMSLDQFSEFAGLDVKKGAREALAQRKQAKGK